MDTAAGAEPGVMETRKPRESTAGDDRGDDGVGKTTRLSGSHESKTGRSPSGWSSSGGEEQLKPKSKLSSIKEMWGKLGLDIGTLMMMFKGSVAPTIGIAFYQADSVAKTFSTLGYLVPIISVLCIPIMPRAKYLQTLTLNVIGICIGSAVSLLGIWSGVKAREHTTPVGSTATYNSSQSAVCAIWLFANIWFVNVLRAKVSALQFPVIMYSIFTNVSFTYGPLFPTMSAGISLIKELLKGFLTAFAISTGVHLFIIPVSSRTVVFKEQAGYIGLIRGTLKSLTEYLRSLESGDMFASTKPTDTDEDQPETKHKHHKKEKQATSHPAQNNRAAALKGNVAALTGLHGKLFSDVPFAKKETAWGKLDAKDIEELGSLFRGILIPLIGMSTITDIFERIAERRGWVTVPGSKYDKAEAWEECDKDEREKEKETWNEIMKTLHEPFEVVTAAMDEGLQHAGIILELTPKPKVGNGGDVEAKGDVSKPGDADFANHLDQKMTDFYSRRGQTIKAWARQKGMSADQFDEGNRPYDTKHYTTLEARHRRDQQQLYLILYLECLLYSAGMAISDLIRFADKKVADGTMKKNRLIWPGQRRLKKWILHICTEDNSVDTNSPDSMEAGNSNIYMGAGFNAKKDPEHLPPQTAWQHFGNGLRTIPHFLGSTESAFGLRVACATLTIGITAFLEASHTFFMEQRLVWAMIIIAIGMTMTSGQSLFGFFGRLAGTSLAMVASLIIWYVVDQKTPGIIAVLWLFIFMEMYLFLKFPRFISIWLVAIVTQVLILGYELQVRKIGVAAATASGQPYYPIYELGPYRLACVAGGSFVAFIWTVFPYPLSDRSWLRKDLGSTLYLLANYYSVVHTTIGTRMRNTEGDMSLKSSPGRRLEKARHNIFGKLLLLLPSLKQHAEWQKWEPTIGGKFPRDAYEGIILRATNIMNYLAMMSYATRAWSEDSGSLYPNTKLETRRKWLNDLSVLVDSVGPTSHQITSTLSLLSASVKQGSALPPYMQLPEPYDLSRKLEALDKGILDSRHVEEPGYSAYAVLQVCSSLVGDDLRRLVDHVKDLVGETDFSFTVNDSETSVGESDMDENRNGKGKSD